MLLGKFKLLRCCWSCQISLIVHNSEKWKGGGIAPQKNEVKMKTGWENEEKGRAEVEGKKGETVKRVFTVEITMSETETMKFSL